MPSEYDNWLNTTERIRKLKEAVEIGIAMLDPENQPAQWSVEDALKKMREATNAN